MSWAEVVIRWVTCKSGSVKNHTQKVRRIFIYLIGQLAEGVHTVKIVKRKAEELGVYRPLGIGLYKVLFEGRSVAEVGARLMQGEQNYDVEFTVRKS